MNINIKKKGYIINKYKDFEISTKYNLLNMSKEEVTHLKDLNKFFKRKKNNDILKLLFKKSQKKGKFSEKNQEKIKKSQKSNKFDNIMDFKVDMNSFSLVDSQDVVKVSVQRINKNNINELIQTLKNILKKIQFELIIIKYNILFDFENFNDYATILEQKVQPLEKSYDIMNKKLLKLLQIKDNYILRLQEKTSELILNKNTLKDQLIIHKQNEDKSEFKKYFEEYMLNERNLFHLTIFKKNMNENVLETKAINIESTNNSFINSLLKETENPIISAIKNQTDENEEEKEEENKSENENENGESNENENGESNENEDEESNENEDEEKYEDANFNDKEKIRELVVNYMDQVPNEKMDSLTSQDIIEELNKGNISFKLEKYSSFINELIIKYKESLEKNEDMEGTQQFDEDEDEPYEELKIGGEININDKDNILGVETL